MLFAYVGLALSLCASAFAEVKSFADFSGGLNTRTSSVLLQENESPDLQNVILDDINAITRRKGYTKLNATAIGGGISDVNSTYQLEQSGGNKYCVAFSSTTGYYSVDGCGSFTAFISTLTRNNDVNCDPYLDRLYCVNNQQDFYFDGTNDVLFSGPATLNYIRAWRNRCFAAGNDTYPSRLYWSNLGDCNTWTTATDYVDIDAEDGDVITGIGPDLFNFLPIYKKFSTYLLQFDNANTANRKLINVSRSIGAKNHRAIANYNNRQYFMSVGASGGQPGIYSTDGILIDEASAKIRSEIEGLNNFFSNTGRHLLDTKADWDTGTFDHYAMSSARDSGLMQSSYTSINLTTSDDWSGGTLVNVTTKAISGAVVLSTASTIEDFEYYPGGNLTGTYSTSITTWTITNSTFRILTGDGDNKGFYGHSTDDWCIAHSSNVLSEPYIFEFDTDFSGPSSLCRRSVPPPSLPLLAYYCWQFRLGTNDNNYYFIGLYNWGVSGDHYYVRTDFGKVINGVETVLGSGNTVGPDSYRTLPRQHYTVTRTDSGDWTVSVGSNTNFINVNDSSILGGFARMQYVSYSINSSVYNFIDNIDFNTYSSTGSYRSPILDTSISTPIGGVFSSTQDVSMPGSAISYYVRESTASDNGGWSDWSATSDTLRVPMSKRYQQIEARFYTPFSTQTPVMHAIGVTAASTGTWLSPEIYLSNSMTTWGTLQTVETKTGAGSIVYAMRSSTYSGGTAYAPWVAQSAGSVISVDTGAYVQILSTFTIYSASESAKLDSLVINWNEGAAAKSGTMAVYKNRLHFCGQTSAGTYNDVCYVLDTRGAWSKWTGVNARHLNVVGQNFVASGSKESSAGYLYKLYDSDSDDGAAINAYWESKDHPLGNIQNRKAVDRFYTVASPDATVLTATIGADTGIRTLSYDLNLSTGMTFKISHKPITSSLNGNVFRMKFSNNAASKPWSVLGYGLQYRDLGLIAP